MLPLHPFLHLRQKGFRPQYLYHGPERKHINQKLGFIRRIIIDRAEPAAVFLIIFRMLFIAGKMEHAPFQRVTFAADLQQHRLFGPAYRLESVSGDRFRDMFGGKPAFPDFCKIQKRVDTKGAAAVLQTTEAELIILGRILYLIRRRFEAARLPLLS